MNKFDRTIQKITESTKPVEVALDDFKGGHPVGSYHKPVKNSAPNPDNIWWTSVLFKSGWKQFQGSKSSVERWLKNAIKRAQDTGYPYDAMGRTNVVQINYATALGYNEGSIKENELSGMGYHDVIKKAVDEAPSGAYTFTVVYDDDTTTHHNADNGKRLPR